MINTRAPDGANNSRVRSFEEGELGEEQSPILCGGGWDSPQLPTLWYSNGNAVLFL